MNGSYKYRTSVRAKFSTRRCSRADGSTHMTRTTEMTHSQMTSATLRVRGSRVVAEQTLVPRKDDMSLLGRVPVPRPGLGLTDVDVSLAPRTRNVVVRASKRRWERWYVAAVLAGDAVAVLIASVTAYLVRFGNDVVGTQDLGYVTLSMAMPALFLTALYAMRAYEPRFLLCWLRRVPARSRSLYRADR